MEKNYVEIQGRFSSDGRFVGGNYVPEVIDKLMNDVYSTLGQAGSLYRLRVTVEVEDLGAEVKFGKPVPPARHGRGRRSGCRGQVREACKRNAALPCSAAFDRWKADSCTGHLPCRH